MTKIVWMCSCGMYWIFSERDARRHEKESGHKLYVAKISDEEWERLQPKSGKADKK